MDKYKLFEEICDFYNCSFVYNEDGSIEDKSNDIPDWINTYINIDEALKEWLYTLEESNKDCQEQANINTWSEEKINFIKTL